MSLRCSKHDAPHIVWYLRRFSWPPRRRNNTLLTVEHPFGGNLFSGAMTIVHLLSTRHPQTPAPRSPPPRLLQVEAGLLAAVLQQQGQVVLHSSGFPAKNAFPGPPWPNSPAQRLNGLARPKEFDLQQVSGRFYLSFPGRKIPGSRSLRG